MIDWKIDDRKNRFDMTLLPVVLYRNRQKDPKHFAFVYSWRLFFLVDSIGYFILQNVKFCCLFTPWIIFCPKSISFWNLQQSVLCIVGHFLCNVTSQMATWFPVLLPLLPEAFLRDKYDLRREEWRASYFIDIGLFHLILARKCWFSTHHGCTSPCTGLSTHRCIPAFSWLVIQLTR